MPKWNWFQKHAPAARADAIALRASEAAALSPPGTPLKDRFFDFYAAELLHALQDRAIGDWYSDNVNVSLCHRDTLIALSCLTALEPRVAVEFGAYIGGTSIALGRGAKASGGRVITVEKGGAYAHPVIPSSDILGDLRSNLARFEVSGEVSVIEANYAEARERLVEALGGERISILVVDADGHFDLSLKVVADLLEDGAVVVIDDYRAPFAVEKEVLTRPIVDKLVEDGMLTPWGALSGVTWIGQWRMPAVEAEATSRPRAEVRALVDRRQLLGVIGADKPGCLNAIEVPVAWAAMADDKSDNRSPMLLFENGQLIGPAHTPHLMIAEHGNGSFSHWRDKLWFSSAGARSSTSSGKVYEARLGSERLLFIGRHNPHFEHGLVVWRDKYSGIYQPVAYGEQFDSQWKLFLENVTGYVRHTGVDTSDPYIDDRIEELTGVKGFIANQTGDGIGSHEAVDQADRRSVGGRLFLEPKFPIDYFRGKRCLDVGCGAGRWTRTMLTLGAEVKSVDMSEHGLRSTSRFNSDVERLDLFDIRDGRPDLHSAFDFVLCWGVVMCTHDPLAAFESVSRTVKPGGDLYVMVYAPTYHASEFVTSTRKHYHRALSTIEERMAYVDDLTKNDRDNAINYLDMLNTEYNWTIDEDTLRGWAERFGFEEPVFLNAAEPHKGAHHVLMRRRGGADGPGAQLADPFYVHKDDPFGALLDKELSAGATSPSHRIVEAVRSRPLSMLAPETLAAMHLAVRSMQGAVVEIGAYVGGATVVMLDAAAAAGVEVITIEEPVRHSHPQIPTANSVTDLRRNVAELAPPGARHTLLCGCSFESWVLGELQHCLLGKQIGFFACDADGFLERDLAYLSPFMAEQCLIMIDDYEVGEPKSGLLTAALRRMIASGLIELVAHLPWGTVFARLKRRPTAGEVTRWQAGWAEERRGGNPYAERFLEYVGRTDADGSRKAIPFDERQAFWQRAHGWNALGE